MCVLFVEEHAFALDCTRSAASSAPAAGLCVEQPKVRQRKEGQEEFLSAIRRRSAILEQCVRARTHTLRGTVCSAPHHLCICKVLWKSSDEAHYYFIQVSVSRESDLDCRGAWEFLYFFVYQLSCDFVSHSLGPHELFD